MAQTTELAIVLKAVDQASSQLKQVQKTVENFGKTTKATSSGVQGAFGGLMSSAKQLAMVFGVAFGGYQLVSFFKESAKEAIKAQAEWDLVASRVKAAGISWQQAEPAVRSFSTEMQKLGRNDEEMALSVSKLLPYTKSMGDAMKMSKLASDLMASGIGNVTDNTDLLQRILIGKGQRAMIALGIAIKDNATSAEQLAAVYGKVKRTTEEWAKTTEGQVAIATEAWAELKEQLGTKLLPIFMAFMPVLDAVIQKMMAMVQGISYSSSQLASWMQQIFRVIYVIKALWDILKVATLGIGILGEAFYEVGAVIVAFAKDVYKNFTNIGKIFKTFGEAAKEILSGNFSAGIDKIKELSKIKFDFSGTMKRNALSNLYFSETAKAAGDAWKQVGEDLKNVWSPPDFSANINQSVSDISSIMQKAQNIAVTKMAAAPEEAGAKNIKEGLKKASESYEEFVSDAKKSLTELKAEHDDKMGSVKEKLQELGQEYDKVSAEGVQAIAKLKEENIKNIAEIDKSISDLSKQISNLGRDYARQQASDITGLAEAFIAEEQKIADLREQLRRATDAQEIVDLKAKIAAEEAGLANVADTQTQYTAEIAEARRRAGLSDIERAIEDFNTKRALAKEEFDERMSEMQSEMSALQEKRNYEQILFLAKVEEIKKETAEKLANIIKETTALIEQTAEEKTLYDEKTRIINKMLADAEIFRQQQVLATKQVTIDSLNEEIAAYSRLAQAAREAASARYLSTLPNANVIGSRQTGGYIPETGAYMLHQGEYVVPKEAVSPLSGSSYVVNIMGGTYLSESVAEKIGNMIISRLKQNIRI
jgi:hypothetical protein